MLSLSKYGFSRINVKKEAIKIRIRLMASHDERLMLKSKVIKFSFTFNWSSIRCIALKIKNLC